MSVKVEYRQITTMVVMDNFVMTDMNDFAANCSKLRTAISLCTRTARTSLPADR
jgi:hypothetical protein